MSLRAMGLLAALCVATACALGPAPLPGPVTRVADVRPGSREAEVLDEVLALYRDLSARDWEAFADHYWDGAVLATVWQPVGEDAPRVVLTSVPEFVRQAPEGPGSREVFEEWLEDAELRVTGDLAHVWSRYGARFGDPPDLMEWAGIDSLTLMEHGGRWRVVSVAYVADH